MQRLSPILPCLAFLFLCLLLVGGCSIDPSREPPEPPLRNGHSGTGPREPPPVRVAAPQTFRSSRALD